jgi:hypothetical protein
VARCSRCADSRKRRMMPVDHAGIRRRSRRQLQICHFASPSSMTTGVSGDWPCHAMSG